MINFMQLTIEGFGCYAIPKTFHFKEKGLRIIRGINGSGKTTIPSALCWGLFGKPLKENSSNNLAFKAGPRV